MANVPSVFFGPLGQLYTHGVAAAGTVKYLDSDVALSGSLVQVFTATIEPNARYDLLGMLYVNMSGAGIVTTSIGVVANSPTIRQMQLAEASAATALKSSAGVGDQAIASGSIATGVHGLFVCGSVSLTAAGGTLFLSVSTGGTGLVAAGSTFRVSRSE